MSTERNYVQELHHYLMWSQDNIAELIDVTRPKIKKMLDGNVKPNNIQDSLLAEVVNRQLTYKKFVTQATKVYRLKLIRESKDD